MPDLIIFAIGLAASIRGADWIGRAAIGIAKKYKISEMAVGATLVSLATTLPEISTTVVAGFVNKEPAIGIGAVLGSPLVNMGLIMGLFFIFAKKRPKIGYYSRSVNIFVALAFLLLLISTSSAFGGLISILLIALGIAFLTLELLISRHPHGFIEIVDSRFERLLSLFDFSKDKKIFFELFLGAIFLALGSKFIVDSVYSLAVSFKLSELFISLTLVAIGTSFPELLTAINSLIYKREDIAIGNLIGASVIDLTLGVGLGTLPKAFNIAYPLNFLIFIPMILIGILSLLVLLQKIPIRLVGFSLVFSTTIFFIAYTFFEVMK